MNYFCDTIFETHRISYEEPTVINIYNPFNNLQDMFEYDFKRYIQLIIIFKHIYITRRRVCVCVCNTANSVSVGRTEESMIMPVKQPLAVQLEELLNPAVRDVDPEDLYLDGELFCTGFHCHCCHIFCVCMRFWSQTVV